MKTIERTEVHTMPAVEAETRQSRAVHYLLGVGRLVLGFEFLWAFFDKLLGLGFATGRAADTGAITFFGSDAWIHGGSPTAGVVGFGLHGPFTHFFQTITGYQMTQAGPTVNAWVDWVYMLAILAIGLGLMTGIMSRLAAIGGIVWMAIFYMATAVWPAYNPFVDEHVIAIVLLAVIAVANVGRYLGFGGYWQRLDVVKRHPILY